MVQLGLTVQEKLASLNVQLLTVSLECHGPLAVNNLWEAKLKDTCYIKRKSLLDYLESVFFSTTRLKKAFIHLFLSSIHLKLPWNSDIIGVYDILLRIIFIIVFCQQDEFLSDCTVKLIYFNSCLKSRQIILLLMKCLWSFSALCRNKVRGCKSLKWEQITSCFHHRGGFLAATDLCNQSSRWLF